MLDTSKRSLNRNLCMQYTELSLLLACGYFNLLDETSFQSYLIYYIKYSIRFCLLNELVNIIIVKESPYIAWVLQLSSLVLLFTLYWTWSAHTYPHLMLALTLQNINYIIQPHSHCTSRLACYNEPILPGDSQFSYGHKRKLVSK